MRIVLYQMNILWEEKEANYTQVETKLNETCINRTDLFLLPEMSFTGFSMNTEKTKESNFKQLVKYQIM